MQHYVDKTTAHPVDVPVAGFANEGNTMFSGMQFEVSKFPIFFEEKVKQLQYLGRLPLQKILHGFVVARMCLVLVYKLLLAQGACPHSGAKVLQTIE